MCGVKMMQKWALFFQVLQLDTGSTFDPLYAGFSEEFAQGDSLLLRLYVEVYVFVFTHKSFMRLAGYWRGLGERKNA